MAESEEEYDEFEEQLRMEKAEKERRSRCSNIVHGQTRTDPDGTVYEWDADKMAYFPKIDADFIAQYQMNYGSNLTSEETTAKPAEPAKSATEGATDWSTYFTYVQKYITEHGTYPPEMTKAHKEYYVYLHNYYYGSADKKNKDKTDDKKENHESKTDNSDDKENEKEESKDKETKDKENSGEGKEETPEEKAYREYYEKYQEYYKSQGGGGEAAEDSEQKEFDEWAWYNYYYGAQEGGEEEGGEGKGGDEKGDEEKDEKKEGEEAKKKRKATDKPGWFEIEEQKNTNVYVSGLPEDVTDDEFKELMNKCGMIMYDPRTQKMKLKLYRDSDGKPKGDGLCCYIKSESVDLALQMLDDYDVRGYKISVDLAKFEMKGKFDPKRRKKLSNRERKKMRQQQEKALDWRPDKPFGYRPKNERIIVIHNAFDYKEFERDPAKIQTLREDLRAQCNNFGTVKKVIVYDRNQLGVVTVAFDDVPEADLARESLHGRFFQRRQIEVTAWDGKTKYDVAETDAERTARLATWATYLESGEVGPPPAGERPEGAQGAQGAGKKSQTGTPPANPGKAPADAANASSSAGSASADAADAPVSAKAEADAGNTGKAPSDAADASSTAGSASADAPDSAKEETDAVDAGDAGKDAQDAGKDAYDAGKESVESGDTGTSEAETTDATMEQTEGLSSDKEETPGPKDSMVEGDQEGGQGGAGDAPTLAADAEGNSPDVEEAMDADKADSTADTTSMETQ